MLSSREVSPAIIMAAVAAIVVVLAGAWFVFFRSGGGYYGGKHTVPRMPPGASGAMVKPSVVPAGDRSRG